jgi:hypothetical protein
MAQCLGTTKSGSRCKRSAGEGSLYCSAHEDQAPGATRNTDPPEIDVEVIEEALEDRDSIDTLIVAAALGAAVVVVLAVGKLFRL